MRQFFLGGAILAFSLLGLAQAEISAFPLGLTEMVWSLHGLGPPQELRLTVEGLPEGKYRVVLSLSLEGAGTELSMLGFLGAPLSVTAMGSQVDLSTLNVLIRRREMLKVGEQYALPGGQFYAREKVEIAGVLCLVGEFHPADRPDLLIELGFSLSDPVYLLPLLRVKQGERVTFEMVLTKYSTP